MTLWIFGFLGKSIKNIFDENIYWNFEDVIRFLLLNFHLFCPILPFQIKKKIIFIIQPSLESISKK